MRSDIIRIYKSVHTWTGILSGMALFIAFYAGSITVFKDPLNRWASPQSTVQMVPLGEAQELIAKTLRLYPDAAKEFVIHLQDSEHTPARMGWQIRAAGADEHDASSSKHFSAYLDSSGNASVSEIRPTQLATFIDVLHRVVGLPVDTDHTRWVMGGVAILYALALVSGLIVFLPAMIKDLFAMRVGKNLKRMWLDAHNVVGIISLPFHIIIAMTAVGFAFHDEIYLLQNKLLHEGKMAAAFQGASSAQGNPSLRDPAKMLKPGELLERVRTLSAGFEPTVLQYRQITGPRAVVRVWGKDSHAVMPRARGGFVAIDPYSGKILSSDNLPGKQSTPNLIVSSLFALHMAAFGGTYVQFAYFLIGIGGAWLFFSGNLLWIESRRRRAAKGSDGVPIQSRAVRVMASLSVGVCLGCVCGISVMIAATKGLHGVVNDINAWYRFLYYGTFFSCVGWALWRGAGQAAVHLLWLATAATLAIPLSTLAAIMFPGLGWWGHTSIAALGVDATALAGALCLAWMARVTASRMRNGEKDSVWSYRVPDSAM